MPGDQGATKDAVPRSIQLAEIVESDEKLRAAIEGSHLFSEPWEREEAWRAWEEGRKFIASAIDRDGTVLDFGSANGFLLKCLQA